MAPKILQFEYHSTRDDDDGHDAKALYDDWGGGEVMMMMMVLMTIPIGTINKCVYKNHRRRRRH